MAITALDCPTRGSLGVCPECGRSVPDTCGKDDPREEAPTPTATEEQKAPGSEAAPEPSQEAAGESEAPQATQVAETSTEATSEAPAQPVKTTSRKAAAK